MNLRPKNAEQKVHNEEQHEHNVEQHDHNVEQDSINVVQKLHNTAQEIVNISQETFNNAIRRYVRRALIGYLILAAAIVVAMYSFYSVRATNYERLNVINERQCDSISNLYNVIRATIQENDERINTLTYYKEHPLEAQQAHAANTKLNRKFKAPSCPRDITVSP